MRLLPPYALIGLAPPPLDPPYGRTLAEVSEAEKVAVAHRGIAFRAFADWIRHGGLTAG